MREHKTLYITEFEDYYIYIIYISNLKFEIIVFD